MKKIHIIMSVFCLIFLSSCVKDEMEVQKNNDLSWKIDDSIVNADIRTRIGYDPRLTYAYLNNEVIQMPVNTLGDIFLSSSKSVAISLSKPTTKELTISLSYDASLFDSIKNDYPGYSLGDASSLTLTETQKTMAVGQSSVGFDIEGNFSQVGLFVFPFSVSLQGDDDIVFAQKTLVITSSNRSVNFDVYAWSVDVENSSQQIKDAFTNANNNVRSTYGQNSSLKSIKLGNYERKNGIVYMINYSNSYDFDTTYNFSIEKDDSGFQFNNKRSGEYWNYFGTNLGDLNTLIVDSAPYTAEKFEGGKIKFISVANPQVWFILTP